MLSAVIFDVANVLVDWEPSRPLRGVLPDADVDAFVGSRAFWDLNAEADAGLPLAEVRARVAADLPALLPAVDTYLARFPLSVAGPIPGSAEVVDALLDAGVPVYGLSNWSSENFHVARAANPAIDRLAGVVVSGDVGLAKPDEAIFRLTLDRFGLDAASTVMIDDTPINLDAAARVGLATLHFTGADRLRTDLLSLGLLPPQ